MADTIENTNRKITTKIKHLKEVVSKLKSCNHLKDWNEVEIIENSYNLAIVPVLSNYYTGDVSEVAKTEEYYRIIISENFAGRLDFAVHHLLTLLKSRPDVPQDLYAKLKKKLVTIENTKIYTNFKRHNYDTCSCGTRMDFISETSEMQCPNDLCGKLETIYGSIMRDEQHHTPHDGQKKHGGYDTSRHYRFWMERLQALESTTFEDEMLNKIEYVLNRDNYNRQTLTCEEIREVLKDSKVNATTLNDHAPLLVKLFGGPAPPRFTHREHRILSVRFNKVMALYDIVKPTGGNKPYYPYFIYKIVEHEFRENPEKLRLLDYIHLQSRETVIKNDKTFLKICSIALETDGLHYSATDPSGRL
jgi:hypothetical protein